MSDEKIVLSKTLVEEIFQQIAKEPYVNVAMLMAKLQAEVLPQINSPQMPPPSSSTPPPTKSTNNRK